METHEQENLFRRGIHLFNQEEFFECHEVLEELWAPSRQPERWFLQSLIHFAVGFHHHRLGNAVGCVRQLNKGLRKIQEYLPAWGGIETESIERKVQYCLGLVEADQPIETFPKIEPFCAYAARVTPIPNSNLA